MAGLALSAVRGIVPGIATYAVLRGGCFLFAEKKIEEIVRIFKANVKDNLGAWNARESHSSAQINFVNAFYGTIALSASSMTSRLCCGQIKQDDSIAKKEPSDKACYELSKEMEAAAQMASDSLNKLNLAILIGSIGGFALSCFFVPVQVKSGGLASHVLYHGISAAGCLMAANNGELVIRNAFQQELMRK